MLKYKIPQIVTLTPDVAGDNINKNHCFYSGFFHVGMRRLERPTPTSRT